MKQTFLFLMLFISALGFSQHGSTNGILAIDFPIDDFDPQPVVTSSNVTVATSNLKVNNTVVSGNTVNLTTQSSNISLDCLLTTLDGSTNNTFGNLYVYFKESATSSPIMVNYFQSVTFLPPTGSQTNYTSSLLNQSFLLNKSDFYNTGGLFYIEYKNNNNETFRSQNYNVTGGTKTLSTPDTINFNIQEIKYSEGFSIINNKIIIPYDSRTPDNNNRLIDITLSGSIPYSGSLPVPLTTVRIFLKKTDGTFATITTRNIPSLTNDTIIKNIYLSSTDPSIIGSTIMVSVSFGTISAVRTSIVTIDKSNFITNNNISDHKLISSGQSISFLNQNTAQIVTGTRPQIIFPISVYKWQYKIQNTENWIDFANQSNINFPSSGQITQNMLVRRVAFHSNGHYGISNIISVSVNSPFLTNTICCNQTMVNGNIPQNFIGSLIAGNNYSYVWEKKQIQGVATSNNNYWTEISNSNNKDYIFSLAFQNRGTQDIILYRRLIKENEIVRGISNEVSLTINNASRIGIYNNSTENIKENNNINNSTIVFPNPTKENLNIELPNNNYKKFAIVNILGEVVKENTINNQKNLIIDMSNYKSGIYFLILEDNLGSIQSRKIIKE